MLGAYFLVMLDACGFAVQCCRAMSFQSASKPYKNTLELQDVLMEEARKPECSGAVKAQIARAFADLEKLKRVMRGLPANTSQSIKPIDKAKQRKRITGPIEPIE